MVEDRKNYIDEKGNYHNVENLSLTDIYQHGFYEGLNVGYKNGYVKGQKPTLCEKCDFKKFTQKMVDIIVELMVEYDIADLDELKAKLIGGPTAKDYAEAGKALAEGIEEGMKRYCGVDMEGGET